MKLSTTLLSMMFSTTILAQGMVDVHSHFIPTEYLSALKSHDMLADEGFPLPRWNGDEQLKWMDTAGIQTSVLTLAAPHPYFGDALESAKIIRMANKTAAKLKEEHPDRFLFCAALPLPDVDKAIEEAEYALDVLHADGIKLATNSRGQYLGAPELDRLFSVLNERKAVVIIHPHRPEPVSCEVMMQTPLAMQEYLSETTRAVANMISRNVLARYPEIKIVVPHCGAYLPLAIPRMKALLGVMQANNLVGKVDWEASLSALYYDLAGAHSPETIRMMLTITTPDHLLYGSDYPYADPQMLAESLARMKQYLATDAALAPFRKMILEHNARRLFGETVESTAANPAKPAADGMLVRIAEVEIHPQYVADYLSAAREIERASLAEEPGVVCLFPNQAGEDSTQIRILEIYASPEAYQHHLQTAHFQRYKQGTLHMVKALKLQDLKPLDAPSMRKIFQRMDLWRGE